MATAVSVFNGDRVSVQEGEKFRRRMMATAAQQCECTQRRNVHLNMVKIARFILCDFYQKKKRNKSGGVSSQRCGQDLGKQLVVI